MRFIQFAAASAVLSVLGLAAKAELIICNQSAVTHSIAVAYSSDGSWRSEGWWNIEPSDCSRVVGGELKQRYYYYRATADGRNFEGEDFYFCTQSSVFNISGDEDCSARGYERSEFRKLDTGKTAKKFTLTLTETASSGGEAANNAGSVPEAGSMGEPITSRGIFKGCEIEDGAEFCSVVADGWQFYAYSGSGTPAHLIDQLYNLSANISIEFEGDIVSFGDMTAEVVLRSYRVVSDPYAAYSDMLQGEWYSTDDTDSHVLFTGSRKDFYYAGERMEGGLLRVADTYNGSRGAGPVLIYQADGDPETQCYVIIEIDPLAMTLSYVGGTGQFLNYRKLD